MSTLTTKNKQGGTVSHLLESDKHSPTVLAVDDQPICRAILEKLIEAQGVTVEVAQDGKEALALWKAKQHALIITDCHMPKMNGYDLAAAIRDIEKTNNLDRSTIVALTANALKEEEHHCAQVGIDDVLLKPINHAQIESLFASWSKPNAAPQSANYQIVDSTILAQIFPDAGKQLSILEGFLTHIQSDYSELEEHTQQGNISTVGNIAHRMKGSCKMVGVNRIAELCELVEVDVKNGTVPKEASLSELSKSIKELSNYLQHQSQNTSLNTSTDLLEESK